MDLALAPETLARWQFGITTVYHFLFVPLTISLAALTAGLQTAWVRTEKEKYLKATKFWGKLFLITPGHREAAAFRSDCGRLR